MKTKLFLAACAAVLTITAATAAPRKTVLATFGEWEAYHHTGNDGTPLCGIQTQIRSHQGTATVFIKYQQGGDRLYVQLFRTSWTWTRRDVDVEAVFSLDSLQMETTGHTGVDNLNGRAWPYVLFWVVPEKSAEWLALFAESNRMTIHFESGNEPDWILNLNGQPHRHPRLCQVYRAIRRDAVTVCIHDAIRQWSAATHDAVQPDAGRHTAAIIALRDASTLRPGDHSTKPLPAVHQLRSKQMERLYRPKPGVKSRITDEMFARIRTLLEQGTTKAEIAAMYAVTPGTLAVQCCRHGISMRKGGRPPR